MVEIAASFYRIILLIIHHPEATMDFILFTVVNVNQLVVYMPYKVWTSRVIIVPLHCWKKNLEG